MKVTVNWLKQYVDFNWSTEELTERLTLLGIEVEGVQHLRGDFEGVVVAQVLTREKHPNADKLSVCRVADGTGERQIVCGAQNFKAGDKVPLILPGSTLPPKPGDKEPFTIKVGRIRGVESHGMMCSADELGLPHGEDGLLILPEAAQVGQPLGIHLGRPGSDTVYDLEITPNRPDLTSLIGIAREIAAITGNPLRIPDVFTDSQTASSSGLSQGIGVQIEAPDLCPRYTARWIQGVRIAPSPDWLRTTLERVGLRSINNVVDVTNYVLWEIGQPLHAFNFNALTAGAEGRRTITIRRSREAERLVTLDGQDRLLPPDSLLIADETQGLALAGIMGGKSSEITTDTTDVLLESAYFHPTGIRRTSKLTGLRSDASYRYERGADIDRVEYASRRAAALIAELAGGTVVPGVVESYPSPSPRKSITLRYRKVNELLGTQLDPGEIEGYLARLGLKPSPVAIAPASDTLTVEVPTFRVDHKREADLIEEVARLFGVDRIPTTPPRGAIGTHPFDAIFDELTEARGILNGLGLDEAQGQTLISAKSPRPTTAADRVPLALENPLSSDMDQLRPTLLPGLLDSLRHNLHQRNTTVRLFEIGRTLSSFNGTVQEGWRLAIVLTGLRFRRFWEGTEREARLDGSDLKGLIEDFAEAFGLSGLTWSGSGSSDGYFLESADISLGGRLPLGRLGQLAPTIARPYDARDPVWVAELDLDQILRRRSTTVSFKSLPQFPSVRRDLAMVVPEATTHETILATIRQTKTPHLEAVELFDLFRGSPVPDGQKSLAYAFTYRAMDRTLKEEEVTASQARISDILRQSLGATLRG